MPPRTNKDLLDALRNLRVWKRGGARAPHKPLLLLLARGPGESAGVRYQVLFGLNRCLCTANVTKHFMLTFQPTPYLFSQTLYVFPLDTWSAFAVLQSRVHEPWPRLFSSSMKTDLRYAASDCFETFPFPEPDPRAVIPELEAIGRRLHEARAAYMLETQQGFTQTYNHLKDPACHDAPIEELRTLHEQMDQAVLTDSETSRTSWRCPIEPP